MRTLLIAWILSPFGFCADLEVEMWGFIGSHSAVAESVDGTLIADRLAGSNYTGYVGQLVLMPVHSAFLAEVPTDAPGLITANNGGDFAGFQALAGFCIDSETPFRTGATTTSRYLALNYEAANTRYLVEGVSHYLPGGLLRAAYLLERFYGEAHGGGDIEAAALQAAIWEVLYDSTPGLASGSGFYYLRTDTGSVTYDSRSTKVIEIADQWFAAAVADGWGGANYDPLDRVIFWLDPDATTLNQSILTLNPGTSLSVPEPAVPAALGISLLLLLSQRRR